AVLAAGDASMVLLQEPSSRGGSTALQMSVPAGPRPGRRHGLYDTPYEIPDLRRLAVAAATASEDPRAIREVVVAVEEVMSSPGYMLAAFSHGGASSQATVVDHHDPNHFTEHQPPKPTLPPLTKQQQRSSVPAVSMSSGSFTSRMQRTHGSSSSLRRLDEGTQDSLDTHGLDVGAIQSCFESLLRLYSGEVVAA
ncbi:hypothetical protein Agub_g11184, partial [Astrephomene gubernaculifera]